jgi:hypothetical protein
LVLLALGICLIVAGPGCPPGEDIPADVLNPNVDLAVGDRGLGIADAQKFNAEASPPAIFLYFHVLTGNSLQDPDVVIHSEGLRLPISLQLTGDFTGNDLYAADAGTNTVQIWRDYRDLGSAKTDGLINPDVVLGCDNFIDGPIEILNVQNRLYVSNQGGVCQPQPEEKQLGGTALVFDHAGAIVQGAGDQPTLVFDVPYARGIAVANDTLYVASWQVNTKDAPAKATILMTGTIYVFDNITGRIQDSNNPKFLPFLVPSAILQGPSFLNIPMANPDRVDVFGNRLYATTWDGVMFVFDHADALVNFQEPAAVIATTTGTVGLSGDMKMIGDTLYVGNQPDYFLTPISLTSKGAPKAGNVGLTAFRPGHGIVSGQNAVLSFDPTNSQIESTMGLAVEGEVLFVAARNAYCCDFPSGDVHVFTDADSLMVPKPADLVLPSLKDFLVPTCIDSNTFVTP